MDAGDLSLESLRLVYRLLFMFYIEARPELGYVPIQKSETYAKGYSLESLRDLELIPLNTATAREGMFFDATLRRLFSLIGQECGAEIQPSLVAGSVKDAFALSPLDCKLFDPASTPMLNEVRFPQPSRHWRRGEQDGRAPERSEQEWEPYHPGRSRRPRRRMNQDSAPLFPLPVHKP